MIGGRQVCARWRYLRHTLRRAARAAGASSAPSGGSPRPDATSASRSGRPPCPAVSRCRRSHRRWAPTTTRGGRAHPSPGRHASAHRRGPVRSVVRGLADPEVFGHDRLDDLRRGRGRDGDDDPPPVIFAPNHHSHLDTGLMVRAVPADVAAPSSSRPPPPTTSSTSAGRPACRRSPSTPCRSTASRPVAIGRPHASATSSPTAGASSSTPRAVAHPTAGARTFKGGAAYLAGRTGAPVVPVYIDGTDSIMGKGMNVPSRAASRVDVRRARSDRSRASRPAGSTTASRPPSPSSPTSRPPTTGRPGAGRPTGPARRWVDRPTPAGAASGTCRSAGARASPAGDVRRPAGGPTWADETTPRDDPIWARTFPNPVLGAYVPEIENQRPSSAWCGR